MADLPAPDTRVRRNAGRLARGFVLFTAAGVIVALAWLATPRALAGIERAEHERTLFSLGFGRGVDEARLISAARGYEASLDHHVDGRTLSELAAMWMRMAKQEGYRTRRGAALLELARTADRGALRYSPMLTRSWSRLTLAVMIADVRDPQVPALLTMAVATAPDNSRVMRIRMFATMLSWHLLNAQQKEIVGEQIVYAARMSINELAVTANRFNRIGAVREALASEPELLRGFDIEIARRISR